LTAFSVVRGLLANKAAIAVKGFGRMGSDSPEVYDPPMSADHPSKTELIAQLQTTIGQLETVLQQLQHKTGDRWESTLAEPITALQTLGHQLTQQIQETPPSPAPEPVLEEEFLDEVLDGSEEPLGPVTDRVLPSFNRWQQWWDGVLRMVRRGLPKSLNAQLSDWGLTSAIAALVVGILLTSAWWVSSQPASVVPEIAETPDSETVIAEQPPVPDWQPIPAPDSLEAPALPEPIELAPPAEPPLTPEQGLLAAIQQEIKDLTRQYPDGLILAIAPDFDHNRLTLTVADSWQTLSPKRQETLANSLWKRARKLTFQKLGLKDQQGNFLARSPVVGENMILLAPRNQNPDSPT